MTNGIQPDEETTPSEKIEEKKVRGEYGMYTEVGNQAVKDIVTKIRLSRSRYDMITDADKDAIILLRNLAKNKGFEEAKDDQVKFLVFNKVRSRRI